MISILGFTQNIFWGIVGIILSIVFMENKKLKLMKKIMIALNSSIFLFFESSFIIKNEIFNQSIFSNIRLLVVSLTGSFLLTAVKKYKKKLHSTISFVIFFMLLLIIFFILD